MSATEIRRLIDLMEGRDAPLYHWMSVQKATTVFRTNRIRALFGHRSVGQKGISLSRNRHFNPQFGDYMVRLTLNQTELAKRYRIVPLDAEQAVGHDYRDRDASARGMMAEEFLIGSIDPLDAVLDEIQYINWNGRYRFMDEMIRYVSRYDIPFRITGDTADWDDHWEGYWEKRRKTGVGGRLDAVSPAYSRGKPQSAG